MEYVYQIGSRHPDSTHATTGWRKQAIGTVLCSECRCIKRKLFPKPIDIVLGDGEYDPTDVMGSVDKIGVTYYHRDLIRQIFDDMQGFAFGKCCDEAGSAIPELVTVYSKHYVIPRGAKDSEYNVCEVCGMIKVYFVRGKEYLLKNQIKERKVWADARGIIYVAPDIASHIDLSQWKYARLKKIFVRDKPIDGVHFPGDPE